MRRPWRCWSLLACVTLLAGVGDLARAGGCRGGSCGLGDYSYDNPDGCLPAWCDPFVDLSPWPMDARYNGSRNWHWWYPYGGFVNYPGEPGTGIRPVSDYSHINWLMPPSSTAQMVTQKLDMLGIPRVPQETLFLDKNPSVELNTKLPVPKNWAKEPPKDEEPEPEPVKAPEKLDKPKQKVDESKEKADKPKDKPEEPKDKPEEAKDKSDKPKEKSDETKDKLEEPKEKADKPKTKSGNADKDD